MALFWGLLFDFLMRILLPWREDWLEREALQKDW